MDNQDSSRLAIPTAAGKSLFVAGVAGIVLMAFLMRTYRIGQQEIWLDEAASFHKAVTPQWLGNAALNENTPPLYYLLLRVWLGLVSWSDASLRLPSAIFGTLFVLTVIYIGKEVFDQRVGMWSGFWAAVNPDHIYYCQEARAYSLLALTLVLTYLALWHALKVNTWRWWALVSASMLLSLYSHYSAILGLMPTVLLVLSRPKADSKSQISLRYGAALLLSVLLFAPWYLGSFVMKTHSWAGTNWIPYVWKNTPPLWAIPKTLEVFGLGSQAALLPIPLKQYTHLEYPASLRFMGLAALIGLAIWVTGTWNERHWGIPQLRKRKLWLGVQMVFPLFIFWIVSFYKPIYVAGRYDFVAFPAFPLLLGLAFAKTQIGARSGRILAPLIAAILLVPIGTKLFLYYKADSPRPNEEIARTIDKNMKQGDVFIFSGLRRGPVMYYLSRLGFRWEDGSCVNEESHRRISCPIFPPEAELFAPIQNSYHLFHSGNEVRNDVRDVVTRLTSPENSLWVVSGYSNLRTGKIQFEPSEVLLFAELEREGFVRSPSSYSWQPGIREFHRRAG
jgi:4-amino-4-deoxy-L-arabinose transferase-like glycosyltransferase